MLGHGLLGQVSSEFGTLFFKMFLKIPFLKYLSKHCQSAGCYTGFLQVPWHPGMMCFGMEGLASPPGDACTEACTSLVGVIRCVAQFREDLQGTYGVAMG